MYNISGIQERVKTILSILFLSIFYPYNANTTNVHTHCMYMYVYVHIKFEPMQMNYTIMYVHVCTYMHTGKLPIRRVHTYIACNILYVQVIPMVALFLGSEMRFCRAWAAALTVPSWTLFMRSTISGSPRELRMNTRVYAAHC